MTYKDYLGNELEVGDEVVFMKEGYRVFDRGIITSLQKRTATLQPYTDTNATIEFYHKIIKVL